MIYRSIHKTSRTPNDLIALEPYSLPRGLFKISAVVAISLYIGGKMAQKGANFLEENEIFVHSEEDDDD
uniref:Essential MCU regulator, mitochondrial n=1 Tax=Acrobeloides nanus TaxID=290746 RepID=A0A914CXM3_9BILA